MALSVNRGLAMLAFIFCVISIFTPVPFWVSLLILCVAVGW